MADDAADRIEIPHRQLSAEALRGVVESFVLREGTEYGQRDYSLAEKVAQMRNPEFRAKLLAEKPNYRFRQSKVVAENFHLMFRLGDPPDYEPAPEKSIAALAKKMGKEPQEVVYDMMLERDGREADIYRNTPEEDYFRTKCGRDDLVTAGSVPPTGAPVPARHDFLDWVQKSLPALPCRAAGERKIEIHVSPNAFAGL